MVITLDGPAGSGKSTVAKVIAKQLDINQVDSGALYRSFTYICSVYARDCKQNIADVILTEKFRKYIIDQKISIEFHSGRQVILWNGEDLEPHIRTPEITRNIKLLADQRFIREEVNRRIGELSRGYSIVADGRDMGTVVFPHAEFKFFLNADLKVRAARRLEEFKRANPAITLEEVAAEIDQRDKEDQNRDFGRLQPAQDAIFVDTTNLELNGVVNLIVNIIQNKR